MCGIAGLFLNNGHQDDALDKVRQMSALVQHRGPDNTSVEQFDEVIFGHSRLSIIDTSDAANQPFYDTRRQHALVFNGEIYNFKVLRNDIASRGEQFKTDSDTEVLLHLLRSDGISSLPKLNGMFSFAWWNNSAKELYLVRDRYGIKPLYYSFQKSGLYFASELRAFRPVCDFRLNKKQLNRLLSLQCFPGEETAIEGIFELKPGHLLKLDNKGDYKISKWFDVDNVFNQPPNVSITEVDIRRQFFKAVERRLVSDVPIGAFLSGGVDSSAIVAAMAQQSSSKIKTFTVGFEDKGFDEREYAAIVAKRYETEHNEILLTENQILKMIPDALSKMDTPSADALNTYIVSNVTKNAGLTVALSGLGGDELFSGYPSFRFWQMVKKIKMAGKVPPHLREKLLRIIPGKSIRKNKLKKILSGSLTAPELVYRLRQVFTDDMMLELGIQPLDWLGTFASEIKNPQNQLSYSEMYLYCEPLLLKDTDQMSMASALEVRVPFLDHEFVNMVMQLPAAKRNYAYRKYNKGFFVDALKKDIPAECYNRPKSGFALPMENWMKNQLKEVTLQGLNTRELSELFGDKSVSNLHQKFLNKDSDVSWSRIWLLTVLGHWMATNKVSL